MPLPTYKEAQAKKAERERAKQERMPIPFWWFKQRDPVARFTLYLGILTLGLVSVGALQWCSIHDQLGEMRASGIQTNSMVIATQTLANAAMIQATAASKSNELSYKAISSNRAIINFVSLSAIAWMPDNPTRMVITINAENIGNSPASDIVIHADCPHFNATERINEPFQFAKWTEARAPNLVGAKLPLQAQVCEIPLDIWNEVRARHINLFVVAKINFIDGVSLNKMREVQISSAVHFDKEGAYSISPIGQHNCSDEQCPK